MCTCVCACVRVCVCVYAPWSSAKPFIGTRDVPVANCSKRALISISKFSTAYIDWAGMTEKGCQVKEMRDRKEKDDQH